MTFPLDGFGDIYGPEILIPPQDLAPERQCRQCRRALRMGDKPLCWGCFDRTMRKFRHSGRIDAMHSHGEEFATVKHSVKYRSMGRAWSNPYYGNMR